jgi:3-ketoacyl-CoA synthase
MGDVVGDRLLQIGVGSGIKCGVNVWRAVRDIHDVQDAWVSTQVDE